MESYMTYVNKGSVEINLDMFPHLKDMNNEELAEELATGDYVVDGFINEIRPKTFEDLPQEFKEDYLDENGEVVEDYDTEDFCSLWDYHRESDVDFDKIKNEEHYFYITD